MRFRDKSGKFEFLFNNVTFGVTEFATRDLETGKYLSKRRVDSAWANKEIDKLKNNPNIETIE